MNTQTQKALKMAIEQLNEYRESQVICATNLGYEEKWATGDIEKAIQACKEALEQPAQEPIHNCPNCNSLFTKEIYSTPAPSWQGLSDDEIDNIMDGDICQSYYEMLGYARAIEQALKEKNA